MRKSLKIALVLCFLSIVMCTVTNSVCLAYDWGTAINTLDSTTADLGGVNAKTQGVMGAIINVTRTVATGIAIIMLLAVAMKYMMSAPADRADIKKHAVVYVVGAIVLFGSSGILGIIQNFAKVI